MQHTLAIDGAPAAALTARPYQTEAVDAVFECWQQNPGDYPLIVLPTAAGKTIVFSLLIQRLLTEYPHLTVWVLAHRKELIEQTEKKIKSVWPSAPVGVYAAGLKRRELAPITVASRDTIAPALDKYVRNAPDLVIVDEAHNVSKKATTRYRKLLTMLEGRNSNLMVLGVTATPFRTGQGYIYGDDDQVFQRVAYELKMRTLLDADWLAPLKSIAVDDHGKIDTSAVKIVNGEFHQAQLAAAAANIELIDAVISEWIEKAVKTGRKHTLFFCVSIAHAELVQQALALVGYDVPMVTGTTPDTARDRINRDFLAGRHIGLVNVGVYTEGTDFPLIDCIVNMRPIHSLGLWLQVAGRGMRISPETGKQDCIASGQRVLTDQGLIAIESVTTEMKVWDGVEFVSHEGVICKGIQKTITYLGLEATYDHKVWTEDGWASFGDCAAKQTPIMFTGNGGIPLRSADRHFRDHSAIWKKTISTFADRVLGMWRYSIQRLAKYQAEEGRVQELRALDKKAKRDDSIWKRITARLDNRKGVGSDESMPESEHNLFFELRGARHRVSFPDLASHGNTSSSRFGFERRESTPSNGPDRQRWSLRNRKHSISHSQGQCLQFFGKGARDSINAFVSFVLPGNSVRRCDTFKFFQQGIFVRANCGSVLSEVTQAERQVWDILNAGPRHRFTCEGLLVSNCLLLDYGGCIERFGPIDIARPAARRGAPDDRTKECPKCHELIGYLKRKCPCGHQFEPTPHKLCPECGEENATSAQRCVACNYIFVSHETAASDGDILSNSDRFREYRVTDVRYLSMVSRSSGSEYLQVVYYCGRRVFKRNLMIGYEGFVGNKAINQWRTMTVHGTPDPASVPEACRILSPEKQGANAPLIAADSASTVLREVKSIMVDTESQYKDIVSIVYRNTEQNDH